MSPAGERRHEGAAPTSPPRSAQQANARSPSSRAVSANTAGTLRGHTRHSMRRGMRKDVREFIRRLEALGLEVEATPGHYRVPRVAAILGARARQARLRRLGGIERRVAALDRGRVHIDVVISP